MANLDIIARLVKKLTAERPTRVSWLGLFGVLFRYILLSIALFVIISVWKANVVGWLKNSRQSCRLGCPGWGCSACSSATSC